jgi:SPP1 gp7 family putative phage head morphogenesis protein
MYLERFGIPPIFALYNSAKWKGALVDKLKTSISRIAAGTAGIIPRETKDDLELWTPEIAQQIATVFLPALDKFDQDIARAILMPGLLGLTADQSQGSFARAKVQFDVFLLVVEFIRNVLSETVINEQLIKPLVDLNYNTEEYPEWQLNPITDNARLDIFEAWANLVDKGVVGTTAEDEVHIREQVEFPERTVKDIEADEEEDEPPPFEPEPEGESEEGDEPEGEQRPPFSSTSSPGRAFHLPGRHDYRQKTAPEKQVNFQRIERTLDGLEKGFVDQGVVILTAERDKLLRRLKAVNELTSNFKPRINSAPKMEPVLKRTLDRGFRQGRKEVKAEVGDTKRFQNPGVKPKDALAWLASLTSLNVKGIDDDLNKQAALALLKAVDNGEGTQGAMNRIRDVFEPYVGNPKKIQDGKVLTAHRLETIIRTNTTDAFNRGRLTQMRELDDFIERVEYSAILDSRTTEICNHLDGRIFEVNSPNLDRFKPPNHFNCRSILVSITPDIDPEDVPERKVDGKDKNGREITSPTAIDSSPQVLAKTRRLVPEGFGGDPA